MFRNPLIINSKSQNQLSEEGSVSSFCMPELIQADSKFKHANKEQGLALNFLKEKKS